MARILAFAGSARRDSLNKKLARVAAGYARAAGGEVTVIDLDDYPTPLPLIAYLYRPNNYI